MVATLKIVTVGLLVAIAWNASQGHWHAGYIAISLALAIALAVLDYLQDRR